MAGIGFALQKLLSSKSITKKFYAFVIATFISSGPWLFSMLSMIIINFFSSLFVQFSVLLSFRVTIIYIYALSIIGSGSIQYLLTKYLADQHYVKKWQNFYPALFTALLIQTFICALFVPLWLYLLQGADVPYKICTIILFVIVCYIWLMMDFLSATKKYITIVISFLIGCFISVILTVTGAFILKNEVAVISGFAIGQIVLFLLLFFFAGKQFPFKLTVNIEFLKYFKMFPVYLFIGGAYNLGLWTDKIMMWIGKGHKIIFNFMVYEPYDFMIFFSYLSIIPALSVFLLKSETSFFISYHKFYKTFSQVTLSEISKNFGNMKRELYSGLLILTAVQACTAAVFYLFSRFTPFFSAYSYLSLPLVLACSFQVLFLFSLVYLMYFNFVKEALFTSMLFLFLNFLLNLKISFLSFMPEGYGYMISALLAFLMSVLFIYVNLNDLLYHIVRKQVV